MEQLLAAGGAPKPERAADEAVAQERAWVESQLSKLSNEQLLSLANDGQTRAAGSTYRQLGLELKVGGAASVKGQLGRVRFIGRTQFSDGDWVGDRAANADGQE